MEDVGLGVEADRRFGKAGPGGRVGEGGLEDADVAVAFEVEELHEGVGVGEAEVVAGEEAEAASLAEEVAEVSFDAADAARHHEADDDVGSLRSAELLAQVGHEGVVFSAFHQAACLRGWGSW